MSLNAAYLLLGSNMGDREKFLAEAIDAIGVSAGKIIARSSAYNTKAWGDQDQNDFLNKAICISTPLSAEALLEKLLSIEHKMGRTRLKRWESRTIDIDILMFNSESINLPHLTVPHPHLQNRRFALVPLTEIAPDFVHPVSRKTIKMLLAECADNLEVSRAV